MVRISDFKAKLHPSLNTRNSLCAFTLKMRVKLHLTRCISGTLAPLRSLVKPQIRIRLIWAFV